MDDGQENQPLPPSVAIGDRVVLMKSVQVLGIVYQAKMQGRVVSASSTVRDVEFDGVKGSVQIQEQFLKSLFR